MPSVCLFVWQIQAFFITESNWFDTCPYSLHLTLLLCQLCFDADDRKGVWPVKIPMPQRFCSQTSGGKDKDSGSGSVMIDIFRTSNKCPK